MSFFKKLFGQSKKNEIPNPKTIDERLDEANDFDESSEILEEETERVVRKNKIWEENFHKLSEYKDKARLLEKEEKSEEAIEYYEQCLVFGEQCQTLKFANYGQDIHRLIILYGKTKKRDKLIDLLEHIIETYPERKEAEAWEQRLNKLQK